MKWETLRSEVLVEDQWIRLRAEACRTPGGARIDPFYIIDYPDWVHVVAVDAQDRVLLVRQWRQGVGMESWELPGGTVDPDDPGPEEAARRELLEETGHAAERLEHFSTLSPNSASQTNRLHAYLAHGARRVAEPKDDPAEELAHEWIALQDVMRRIDSGEFSQSLHVASLLLGLRRLGRLAQAQ